jgi:hypothetical protein
VGGHPAGTIDGCVANSIRTEEHPLSIDEGPNEEDASSSADIAEDMADAPITPWEHVSLADLDGISFENPVTGSDAANCHELSDLFHGAALLDAQAQARPDSPEKRVLSLLSAVLNMYFKPKERNEPFGPMMVSADGRRSPATADFIPQLDVLAVMAERATNSGLKARLSDVCWLLDRRRWQLGVGAVSAYVAVVRAVDQGTLKYRFEQSSNVLTHDTCEHLRRALYIGSAIGIRRPEVKAARELVTELKARAAQENELTCLLWLSELDLEFGITKDIAELGSSMETAILSQPVRDDTHLVVDLWKFAASAYFRAKRDDDAYRCRAEAAESLVRQADAATHSSMLAAMLLSSAIAQLGSSPTSRSRRTELRHRLVDIQAGVVEEMSTLSHPIELTELVDATQQRLGKVGLLEKLFLFACLANPPNPADLVAQARETIQTHPFASLFGATHLDRAGKVIHRTQARGGFGSADEGPVLAQIAQAESLRRQLLVLGEIEVARQLIVRAHYIHQDALYWLLQHSPAVPPDLLWTFSSGFTRFFQGDFTGATYTLTPLLEALLRHVLTSSGHDVTTFDDASQTQEDRSITALYGQMRPELEAVFGQALIGDIENVFLRKPGPHLRHAVAHGLLHDSSPYGTDAAYGCWLIFRICLLPIVRYRSNLEVPPEWLDTSG